MNRFLLSITFFLTIINWQLLSLKAISQTNIYRPVEIKENTEIADQLSSNDIPTGEGGFARDYFIYLEKGDQIAVDLISEDFDSIVILIAEDGTTIAENDDGPDSNTNSLLFTRITEKGKYIVRVTAFGQTGSGRFQLKVSRLRPTK